MTSADQQPVPGGSGAGSTVDSWKEMLRFYPDPLAQIESEFYEQSSSLFEDRAKALVIHVKQSRAALEAARSDLEMWHQHYARELVQVHTDLAQARARTQELVRAITTYRQAAAEAGQPMLPWPALDIALDDAQQAMGGTGE